MKELYIESKNNSKEYDRLFNRIMAFHADVIKRKGLELDIGQRVIDFLNQKERKTYATLWKKEKALFKNGRRLNKILKGYFGEKPEDWSDEYDGEYFD